MTMRRLLRCVAVIAVLNSVGWVAGADPQAAAADAPKLACRMDIYGKYQEAAWKHLPSIGVRCVLMGVPAPKDVDAIKKKLAEHGLEAVVLCGHGDLSKPENVARLAGELDVCRQMGAKYLFISVKHANVSKEVAYERLRQAGDAAKKNGVTIVLETHPDMGTNAETQLETMKAVNHPNVRVNFDTGNISYYNKGFKAADELKKILPYLATVEIKDHSCEHMTWNFPALGRGAVDIPAVLKILQENRYKGPVTIEIEGVQGVARDEATIKRDVEESVRYLRSRMAFQ